MKTSSSAPEPPRLPGRRSEAWSYLITNLLVLPGLGSLMGQRKVSGYLQMALAFAGFIITVLALIKWILAWVQAFEVPSDPWLYKLACLGIGIFLVAWVWSLITSLTFFHKAK